MNNIFFFILFFKIFLLNTPKPSFLLFKNSTPFGPMLILNVPKHIELNITTALPFGPMLILNVPKPQISLLSWNIQIFNSRKYKTTNSVRALNISQKVMYHCVFDFTVRIIESITFICQRLQPTSCRQNHEDPNFPDSYLSTILLVYHKSSILSTRYQDFFILKFSNPSSSITDFIPILS